MLRGQLEGIGREIAGCLGRDRQKAGLGAELVKWELDRIADDVAAGRSILRLPVLRDRVAEQYDGGGGGDVIHRSPLVSLEIYRELEAAGQMPTPGDELNALEADALRLELGAAVVRGCLFTSDEEIEAGQLVEVTAFTDDRRWADVGGRLVSVYDLLPAWAEAEVCG